jgi:hypothetical protein
MQPSLNKSEMTKDRRAGFKLGDVLPIVQLVALLLSMGVAYEKITLAEDQSVRNAQTLERIEHYLSSRDPEYWQRTREE